MMGWGLAAGKTSSTAATTAAAAVAVTILEKGTFFGDVSKNTYPGAPYLEKGNFPGTVSNKYPLGAPSTWLLGP